MIVKHFKFPQKSTIYSTFWHKGAFHFCSLKNIVSNKSVGLKSRTKIGKMKKENLALNGSCRWSSFICDWIFFWFNKLTVSSPFVTELSKIVNEFLHDTFIFQINFELIFLFQKIRVPFVGFSLLNPSENLIQWLNQK